MASAEPHHRQSRWNRAKYSDGADFRPKGDCYGVEMVLHPGRAGAAWTRFRATTQAAGPDGQTPPDSYGPKGRHGEVSQGSTGQRLVRAPRHLTWSWRALRSVPPNDASVRPASTNEGAGR